MKMTVKEFIEMWADDEHPDIDVCDNVCGELEIAYCGTQLTPAGYKHFEEVLEYIIDVNINHPICPKAIIDVDGPEGIWQHLLGQASAFFYSAAGYCSDSDYRKWFREE